jgi:LPS O-antigen subunit length determinant protein (WzzB/FepE family)
MSSYPFNNSFTKQFRQEQPVTFCAEEKSIEQIVIGTYRRAADAEVHALGYALNEQLFDNDIISRLLTKLTQKDSQDVQRLIAYVQQTHQQLRNHATEEPFSAQYYNHLLELLGSFLELVN